jgi:hypothetical protein
MTAMPSWERLTYFNQTRFNPEPDEGFYDRAIEFMEKGTPKKSPPVPLSGSSIAA